jgi:single-stranded DNA-binding protein
MTATVLVTGTLSRNPEQRTSKAGKPFVTASLKIKDGDGSQWFKLLAFSDAAQAEFMRLQEGDAVSAQGALKIETFVAGNGETKVNLTCFAEQVLALRPRDPTPRERKAPEPKPKQQPAVSLAEEIDDDLPF